MSDEARPPAEQLLGVGRTLRVVETIAERPQGVTLQALHRDLGIPLATLHRLLGALEHAAWVERSATSKRFFLGRVARELATAGRQTASEAEPPAALTLAADRTGETVFLTRLIGDRVVCVSLVEAVHPLRLFVRPGEEVPLHAAASARAILAFQPGEEVERLLVAAPRAAFTTGTMREINRILDHLDVVRRRGYDICDDELDDGVWAVAAPIVGIGGRVDAAVALAAAQRRVLDPASRELAQRAVLEAAASLSALGGAIAAPPTTA